MKLQFNQLTFLALAAAAGAGTNNGVSAFMIQQKHLQRTHVSPASIQTELRVGGNGGADEFQEGDADWGDHLKSQMQQRGGSDNGEDSQGGSRLKAMMAASQEQESNLPSGGIDNPFLNPPAAAGGDIDNMSADQLRELLRNGGGTPAPRPQPTQRESPRPAGRNRDADSISNTSDLYFAQLKRDSTVRTLARRSGQDEVANAVMEDEGIEQLEDLLVSNPYLADTRKKEKDLFGTVPEEALAPYFTDANRDKENTSAGVSYKEKLQQRLQKGGVQPATPAAPQAQVPPQTQPEPISEPVQAAPVQPPSSPPPMPEPVVAEPVPIPSPPAPVTVAPSIDSTPLTATSSPEEARSKVRTLMGLTLKHRGGTGFGSGRLKGQEIETYEEILNQVTEMLKQEATSNPQTTAAAVTAPANVAAPVSVPAATGSPGQVDGAIACIEGAVTMYKNSPPEIQSTVLVSLQAALKSAIGTMNSVLGDVPPASTGLGDVNSAIACIEGATTMYKNSPPEIQGTVLISLRAALASAIATMDTAMGQPAAPVAVAPPAPVAAAPTPQVASNEAFGDDENTIMLQEIYDKVKGVAGDGKMGVRDDLGASQLADAVDSVKSMRSIIMEELDDGIPAAPAVAVDVSTPEAAEGSTASKYQQMLAQARAARGE